MRTVATCDNKKLVARNWSPFGEGLLQLQVSDIAGALPRRATGMAYGAREKCSYHAASDHSSSTR